MCINFLYNYMTKQKYGGVNIIEDYQPQVFRGINNDTPFQEYLPYGNWLSYLPKAEAQIGTYTPTLACVTFSALENIEIQMNYYKDEKKLEQEDLDWLNKEGYIDDNGDFNFSDRFVAKLSGTRERGGNNATNVYETIKKYGLVPEKDWPFDREEMTEDEYYKEVPQEVLDKGKEWNKRFKIHFQRVHQSQWDKALKMSPIQVYVRAWHKKDGVYHNTVPKWNHAVTKFNQEDKIRDQYEPFIKQLTPNYRYYEWGFKYDITKKNFNSMDLKKYDNYLVQLVEGQGDFGLIANEKLYIDDLAKILASYQIRNKGNTDGKAVEFTQAQWDACPQYNLKDEKI